MVARNPGQNDPRLFGTNLPNDSVNQNIRWSKRLVSRDINVIALVKGEERYVFLFDDDNRSEALRTLGRYASNPELSFNWYDAAVLGQKVRNATQQTEPQLVDENDNRFEYPAVGDQMTGDEPS